MKYLFIAFKNVVAMHVRALYDSSHRDSLTRIMRYQFADGSLQDALERLEEDANGEYRAPDTMRDDEDERMTAALESYVLECRDRLRRRFLDLGEEDVPLLARYLSPGLDMSIERLHQFLKEEQQLLGAVGWQAVIDSHRARVDDNLVFDPKGSLAKAGKNL